jgi:hypothetical protein
MQTRDIGKRTLSARTAAIAAAIVVVGLGLLAGCTSDESNTVGAVVPPELDLIDPQLVSVRALASFGTVTVVDEERPFDESEVLYLGSKGDEESSILLSYDLSVLPDSIGVAAQVDTSIVKVSMFLYRMLGYDNIGEDASDDAEKEIFPGWKEFEVWSLADTLDVAAYPGPEPALDDFIVKKDDGGEFIEIDIPVGDFLDWWADGRADLMVKAGDLSDEGIIGYASRDLQLNSQHPLALEGTKVGVTLAVNVKQRDTDIVIQPYKDVSTFHALDEPAATFEDGFMMRTHHRRYPWMRFDLADLPDNVVINRAVLRCAVDTVAGYGPLEAVVVSEIPVSAVAGVDSMLLATLEDSAEVISGQTNLDPGFIAEEQWPWIGFNVTTAIQRHVNGVVADETGIIMTAGEDMFSTYDVALWDPEFYLTRFQFFGTGDAQYAPYLEITYTIFSGGQQ